MESKTSHVTSVLVIFAAVQEVHQWNVVWGTATFVPKCTVGIAQCFVIVVASAVNAVLLLAWVLLNLHNATIQIANV